MQVQPYLFFNGRCEEAVELYRGVLGAEVEMLMRYQESPEPASPGMVPPGSEDKVMHVSLHLADETPDTNPGKRPPVHYPARGYEPATGGVRRARSTASAVSSPSVC